MPIDTVNYISIEEYLTRERRVETKNEWIDGTVREVPGANLAHCRIAGAILALLYNSLKESHYETYTSRMRLRIPDGPYYYADVSVAALPPRLEDIRQDTLLNPVVIFEVLSESTEQIDRGEKLDQYRRIESLTDYLLVDQERPRIDHYHRAGKRWTLTITTDLAASVSLPGIGCDLPLAEVYARVFPTGTE